MLCSPWLTPADLTLCQGLLPPPEPDPEDPDPEEPDPVAVPGIERALLVASSWLYRATGRVYPGLCTDTITPCGPSGARQMLAYSHTTTPQARPIGEVCASGNAILCGCDYHPAVQLPGRPVSEVTAVVVDGEPFTDWRLVDDGWLVRSDGGSWPYCAGLLTGSFQITYTWGALPDADGLLAVERLACELLAGWCTGDDCPPCQLPQRLTSFSREGDSYQVAAIDPFEFVDAGRFGIYEVDSFVGLENPGKVYQPAYVKSASDYLRRSHHRIRP